MQDNQQKVTNMSKDAREHITREHAACSTRQQPTALNLRVSDPGKPWSNVRRVHWCLEARAMGNEFHMIHGIVVRLTKLITREYLLLAFFKLNSLRIRDKDRGLVRNSTTYRCLGYMSFLGSMWR
jgi:hypothetical protein